MNKFYNKLLNILNHNVTQYIFVACLIIKLIPLRLVSSHYSDAETSIRLVVLLVDCFVILAAFLRNATNRKFLISLIIPLGIYVLCVFTSTVFVSHGTIAKYLYEVIQLVSCILIFFCFRKDIIEQDLVQELVICFCLNMILFNLVFYILYPNGVTHDGKTYYFFETQNETPNYLFAFIAFILLFCKHGKLVYWGSMFFAVMGIVSIMLFDYSTGRLGATLLVLLYLFALIKDGKYFAKVPIWVWIVIPFSLFLLICVFRFQNVFSFIIVDILHEDLSLHNRTNAWDYALNLFAKQPFIGYGYLTKDCGYSIIRKTSQHFAHSHSEYFELLLRSGIVGFVSFFSVFLTPFRSKNQELLKTDYVFRTVVIVMFAILIMAIDETVFCPALMLVIGYSLFYSISKNNFDTNQTVIIREEGVKEANE